MGTRDRVLETNAFYLRRSADLEDTSGNYNSSIPKGLVKGIDSSLMADLLISYGVPKHRKEMGFYSIAQYRLSRIS